ncbi:MAG: prenyltransferase/squalene oxidase repeat-containing protein [Akkermansiaceae bacterium]|nr:prenyltransferase/squalene oxidase repeat-containing protein [Akkermansiaceae bacterium]
MKLPLTCSLILGMGMATTQAADPYISLKKEIEQAIARGNNWLLEQQKPEGHWDDPDLPAFTALALNAIVRDPNFDLNKKYPDEVEKGFQWLLDQQKEDGGIYNRGLGVYNTATSVTAMTATGREDLEPSIVKGRAYLVRNQWDLGEKGKQDNINDGGIGYGSDDSYSNLSTTYLAIEAIALSEPIVSDGKYGDQPQLNYEAALTFLSRCQNLEATNDQEWANDSDPRIKGGVIYAPGQSKGEDLETKDGRVALRSYGSMTYAGMLSMIYAKVSPDDPRVIAIKEWLGHNYTLEENPGLGPQGLYYYFQAMSKALTAAQMDTLTLEDGTQIDWRRELGTKLLQLQREDGSWVNDNGRFMESNSVLVTAYSVLALEQLYDSFPKK